MLFEVLCWTCVYSPCVQPEHAFNASFAPRHPQGGEAPSAPPAEGRSLEGDSGSPEGGSGGPGGHWASSAVWEISNPPVPEAGSMFPGTPNSSKKDLFLGVLEVLDLPYSSPTV